LLVLLAVSASHWFWFGPPLGLVLLLVLLLAVVRIRALRWTAAALVGLVAIALAVVGVFGGSFGSRAIHVSSADALAGSYDYGVGNVRLDLSGITTLNGDRQTRLRLGRGDVTIVLPTGVAAMVDARTGWGSVSIDGHRVSGIAAEQDLPVGPPDTGSGQLIVDVRVGFGSVTVQQANG
jgi:hypothetical protein